MNKPHVILAGLCLLAVAPLAAHPEAQHQQQAPMDHSKMPVDHGNMMQPTAANPYAQAEMRMHERMMRAGGSNADETFARKMIEHHRGAIEMSQILATRGSDRQLKAAQQKELSDLQAWLRQRRKSAQ